MKLKKLHIQNYKSLVDLEIIEPNPFTVFAGPNGSGKSNIFDAISFWNALDKRTDEKAAIQDIIEVFGGLSSIRSLITTTNDFVFSISDSQFEKIDTLEYGDLIKANKIRDKNPMVVGTLNPIHLDKKIPNNHFAQLTSNFSTIFIYNPKGTRFNIYSSSKINEDASNLENVLNRIFEDENKKEEIIEWMELFVPGLEDVKIESSTLSGSKEIFFKEKGLDLFIPKSLISDGTYNILCLLAAVYQSDEPQFLCIEEPENGVNPYVVRSLVDFFRKQCEEKGHYIWLNTHSQTLVKALHPHELILVDKINGATTIKQFAKDRKLYGLEMDEAWLSNALGGGIPW